MLLLSFRRTWLLRKLGFCHPGLTNISQRVYLSSGDICFRVVLKRDIGLDTLLDLHGTEYHEENGFWYKIEAYLVEATKERPHGIRYNLTLHNKYNARVLGFDNAHAVQGRGKYKGRVITYDHLHKDHLDKGTPYEFSNAGQLLEDFFIKVNEFIQRNDGG